MNGIQNNVAPQVNSKHVIRPTSTPSSRRVVDPNEGRCLLTDRPVAVLPCHLVTQSTDDETLTKLEYVWEVGYRRLNVGARCNVMHLRADWRVLFNDSQWMLIPEAKVLQELSKIYLEDKQPTSNLTKLFSEQTFRYHVLPAPTLQEPICRYSDPQHHNDDTDVHFPPFATLGPLTSHIQPHLVVFNSGQKLLQFQDADVTRMIHFLSQTPSFSFDDAAWAIRAIQELYRTWMELRVPDDFSPKDPPDDDA